MQLLTETSRQNIEEVNNGPALTPLNQSQTAELRQSLVTTIQKANSYLSEMDGKASELGLGGVLYSLRQSVTSMQNLLNNIEPNTSVIENYAEGSAVQYLVTTPGHQIHGSNRGFGAKILQVGGVMDAATAQKISEDMVTMCSR
jgi:hypothetical protein